MAGETVAVMERVSKRYGELLALDGLDLDLRAGEVLALLGPNGAGKSTAMHLLCGLTRPDQGRVRLLGGDPLAAATRCGLGVMLQGGELPDTLTVREHLRLQASYFPHPRPLPETIELAGLGELAGRRYQALSGGEKRRVQFALAICGRPRLLLVDEPTVGMDIQARRDFWQVLRGLLAEGCALLLSTHYLEEADALADRVALLRGGRLQAIDTPAAIKARCGSRLLRCRSALDARQLAGLPGVSGIRRLGEHLEIKTRAAEDLLREILRLDPGLDDLTVTGQSLEDALVEGWREAA